MPQVITAFIISYQCVITFVAFHNENVFTAWGGGGGGGGGRHVNFDNR